MRKAAGRPGARSIYRTVPTLCFPNRRVSDLVFKTIQFEKAKVKTTVYFQAKIVTINFNILPVEQIRSHGYEINNNADILGEISEN